MSINVMNAGADAIRPVLSDGVNKNMSDMRYIYGPVYSRRLGYSLGLDLVPLKVCPYDCIYCQLGRTTIKTLTRHPYHPTAAILDNLEKALSQQASVDYITISGSGEPTLHTDIGEVITGIRRITDIPVAVLTNGALFADPAVREACRKADLVLPSLDAGNEECFRYMNRPCPGITLDTVVDGLRKFRSEFTGEIWLEVFLAAGVNTLPSEVSDIRKLTGDICPDRIQLNSAARPTAEYFVDNVPAATLDQICSNMGPKAEVITQSQNVEQDENQAIAESLVLALLQRRPCSLEDIAASLSTHRNHVSKHLGHLTEQGRIGSKINQGTHFYYAR